MASNPPVNLWSVISESKRIINAHSRHFLALSVFFVLPISFSTTVYPSIYRLLLENSAAHDSVSLLCSAALRLLREDQPTATVSIIVPLAYTVFVSVFSLLANGAITYSVYQGFYGRPVKLISAVKSGLTSFFPLLITKIIAQLVVTGILLVLGFFMFVLIRGIELTGSEVEYSSPYFLAVCIVLTIVSIVILINLEVNWNLAWVIVVVESTWGFLPLKRSKSLINGMKGVSFSVLLFFGLTSSVLLVSNAYFSADILGGGGDDDDGGWWWTNFAFVLQIVVTSVAVTVLLLCNTAANTVLYMYCKAVHGELAWEIAEEFAREYVSLPFDDGKVPHLVSVAYNV